MVVLPVFLWVTSLRSTFTLRTKGSLQRDFRDLHATTLHGLLQMEASAEIYGRVLLGREPNTPIV